jgi:hypothetical protein
MPVNYQYICLNGIIVFGNSANLYIYSNVNGEWQETQRINAVDVGAKSSLGVYTKMLSDNMFITTDSSLGLTLNEPGAFVFQRGLNNNNNNLSIWEHTHSLYSEEEDSFNFHPSWAINSHDVIFTSSIQGGISKIVAAGNCFDRAPNITCSSQIDSCQNVRISAHDLYIRHDSCHVVVEPSTLNLHLNNIYGNMSFDLNFNGFGFNYSCTTIVSCPLPATITPSTVPSSIIPVPVPQSSTVSNSSTISNSLLLYLIFTILLLLF